MNSRCGGWICIFCFSLVSGSAQQNGPAGQSEPAASVSPGSANRRVTLDVVVTDKSGRPVRGLEQRDFTLLDNEQPRKIVSFQAVEGGTATADSPMEVILLVDQVNTAFRNVAMERNEILRFLRRNGGALAQPVSLVFLSESGATATTSSRDGNVVIADLNQKQLGLRSIGEYGFDRIQLSHYALRHFADSEATRPGRKLLVWISPGWPFLVGFPERERQELFNSIVAVSDGLRRARITLYNIDPLGIEDAVSVRTSDYKRYLGAAKTAGQAEYANLALQVLAYQSGGLVLNSSNDLESEIATCVADANTFYVLSFDGLPGDGPNEYHALDIKLDKPGLTARTRSGYYAQPGR